MKTKATKRILTWMGAAAIASGGVMALTASGCELIVDFDRTLIDSGTVLPDVTIPDSMPPKEAGNDGGMDTGTDAPAETGPRDGGDGGETSVPTAAFTITPTGTKDFGSIIDGQSSGAATFTLTNTGTAPSVAIALALSGADSAQFGLSADTCTGNTLTTSGAGSTCTFNVKFSPLAAATASLKTASVNAIAGAATASVTVTGTAVAVNPNLSIAPTPVDGGAGTSNFGNVEVGVTSAPLSFTVTNTGNVATGVPVTPTFTGTNAGDFAIATNTCTVAIAPAGTCTITVTFKPSQPGGAESASLSFTATPGGTTAQALSGTGTTALTLTGASTNFNQVIVGTQSSVLSFTVANTGAVASGIPSVTLTGTNATDFTQTNTCSTALAATTGTCTVNVTITATATGTRVATLNVSATPGGTATPLSLTASAVNQAVLALTPATQSFVTNAGTTVSHTFTVTNNAVAPSVTSGTPTPQAFTGTNAVDFSVSTAAGSNTCNAGLAAGASCSFVVIFAPLSENTSETATLNVTAAGTAGTLTSSLTGDAPGMSFTPASFAFPPSGVDGGPGPSQVFTLKNDMAVSTGTLGAPVASPNTDFVISMDTCGGTALAAGATCTFTVTFMPAPPAGAKSAVVTVTAATPGGFAFFNVTGTGN